MRFVFAVIVILMALGFSPLSARVGETLEQCTKRYGKATIVPSMYDLGNAGKDLVYFQFHKSGIAIEIGFIKGKAADLTFRHVAPDDKTPSPAMTQVEIDVLLKASSDGKQWKKITDGKIIFFPDNPSPTVRYGPFEQRDDGVMATIDGPNLHLFTPEWMDFINVKIKAHAEEVKESQEKNLEGF